MTRALFTTCGRNIFPEPKRSPTTFMPSISGPSMMRNGLSYFCRASSTSATMNSLRPCTSACDQPLLDRPGAPFVLTRRGRAALFDFLRELQQPLGCIRRVD